MHNRGLIIGGVLYLGGVTAFLVGILGLGFSTWGGNGEAAVFSLGLIAGGLVLGAIGAVVLE